MVQVVHSMQLYRVVAGAQYAMKAVRVSKPGPPEDLEIATQVPIPIRHAGEVLVRMHATSVNPLDTKIRTLPSFMINKPKVIGLPCIRCICSVGK